MKIEVISQKKNPLIAREEAVVRVHHVGQSTPSRQEMLKEVAHALKADEHNIIIDRIMTLQGETISEAWVHAYEKKENIPLYKIEKMKRRMKTAKEAEKAAA